ncbi:hypothetical protein [Aquimarina sp. 2304DJ70-9]|uniref:hypothetical protein n=1 Tax=Aquimarina penaris TaxID=3231044 RepID=UPI0034630DC2
MNFLYFLKGTFDLIKESGGPMGFGGLVFPILISINLLMIPAFLTFKNKLKGSKGLLIVNFFGLLWILFWFKIVILDPLFE